MKSVILKAGRQKSLLRRHPWIFSGAIAEVQGRPLPGETVLIKDAEGKPLALAAWSPTSQMRGRVWSFDPDASIDANFFRERLRVAFERRVALKLGSGEDEAVRLCFSESDGLPGLIIDRYAETLVCQFLSAGTEYWRTTIVEILKELRPDHSIFERSDVEVREKEGLLPQSGVLHGREPEDRIRIRENNLHYQVDIRHGHKTGFYLDQKDNRRRLQELAQGKSVLNCFSYTGAFAVAALAGGATSVINIDSSAAVLEMARDNLQLNGFNPDSVEMVEANVFEQLRAYRREQRRFDLIVLDPPKLIDSRDSVTRGARAYKDLNMQAFGLLNPGGLLMTFSCSGLLEGPLFQKIVADGALDARRQGRIIEKIGQSADHPIGLNYPEAEYLKGLIVQVD